MMLFEAEEGLMLYRKLRPHYHDARLVPTRGIAGGHKVQQGPDGREHLSRYLWCGDEYRGGMHCFKIAGLAYDW